MTNDHQAAILAYVSENPIIPRRSDLTAAGIPPDLIGGLLDGLVGLGLVSIEDTRYVVWAERPEDIPIFFALSTVKGMHHDGARFMVMIAKLRTDFPLVNILEQVEHWAAYKLDHPLTAKSNVASQLHTWMKKSLEYGGKANEQGRASTSKRQPTSDADRERSTRQPLR